jgi:hypothetical protein
MKGTELEKEGLADHSEDKGFILGMTGCYWRCES